MDVTIQNIKQHLIGNHQLVDDDLQLNLSGCGIQISSNSQALLDKLRHYFKNCQVLAESQQRPSPGYGRDESVNLKIVAIECAPPELDLDFIDWKREPGKTGRKDEYVDIVQGRVVRKVRTGMVFLQSEPERIAAGPCVQNDNQVINYINSQYMNWLQNKGWLICHASGMVYQRGEQEMGMAIAGVSGGGKSTLMLQLLNNDNISYVTNDRLFIKPEGESEASSKGMLGIPKLPRINPGTIVGNQRLHGLLEPQQLQHFQAMQPEQLWDIEEKNDVPVAEVYGETRIKTGAALKVFILLNWDREGEHEVTLDEVDIRQRDDLLPAIMKSPGPFYQYEDGHFERDDNEFDQQAYISALTGIKIYEAKGTIDFHRMSELCTEVIMSQ